MNRSLIIGIVAGAIAATAGGAYGFRTLGDAPSAEVLKVEPLARTIRVDRQVCADEAVSQDASTHDPSRVAGAMVGVAVGSQGNRVESIEQRCRMVYDIRQEADGYRVHYLLDGQEGVARTERAPGPTIPVNNGQPDLSSLTDRD